MATFVRAVVQHSIYSLSNGNVIVHIRESSESLAQRVDAVLSKFKNHYRFMALDLDESEGIASLSAILQPIDERSEKVFIFRADAALFFDRIQHTLRKFKIDNVSKAVLSCSQGHITAAYVYVPESL